MPNSDSPADDPNHWNRLALELERDSNAEFVRIRERGITFAATALVLSALSTRLIQPQEAWLLVTAWGALAGALVIGVGASVAAWRSTRWGSRLSSEVGNRVREAGDFKSVEWFSDGISRATDLSDKNRRMIRVERVLVALMYIAITIGIVSLIVFAAANL